MKKLSRFFISVFCSFMLVVTMGSSIPYLYGESGSANASLLEQTMGNFHQVAYCKGKKATQKKNKKSPKLNKTSVTLNKGNTIKLKVYDNTKKVKWYTSNKKVATVSNGKVTAKKAGSAKITAKLSNGKKLICKVKVKAAVQDTIVYITRTGSRYHKAWCPCLHRSKIKITLSEAKHRGYSACADCFR